jgi:hypothetical protein
MRLASLFLIAVSMATSQTKVELLTLTDQLEKAIDAGNWKQAAELSTSLNYAVEEHRNRSLSQDSGKQVDTILGWLPADTETIVVAQQPLTLMERDPQYVADALSMARGYVLGFLYAADDGKPANRLQGRTLRLALLAARKFDHQPSDNRGNEPLGLIAFEGCAVYAFANILTESIFGKPPETSVLGQPVWQVKGEQSEKQEKDTYFIALRRPDLMLACSNRDLLSGMLSRMAAPPGRLALPQSLPEWKYVNRSAPLWALRHFRPERAPVDPTDPHNEGMTGDRDPQAIGVVVHVGLPKGTISALWFTRSKANRWQPFAEAPDAKNRFSTRRVSDGVWEVTGSGGAEVNAYAIVVLMGVLGFAALF